ncbi:MAG: helix-turn-helix domain-containing protein [Solirubrobacterales bacterium]
MPPRRRIQPRSVDHQALGEALQELRIEAQLTHEDLADRLDMSFQRISELERGIANPTFATLLRLTEGLDVDLDELVRRIEKRRCSLTS